MTTYIRRAIDDELDKLFPQLPAVSIDGAKGVGKTEAARQRARTVYALDDPAAIELLSTAPELLESVPAPILSQLWLLDPVPAWLPTGNAFTRLATTPKPFLADPAGRSGRRIQRTICLSSNGWCRRHPGVAASLVTRD